MKKLSKRLIFKIFISLILLHPVTSFGAACCGSGFAIPSLITGDERAQFTSSYNYSKLVADVSSSGVWQRHSDEEIQTLKIDAAHIFNDRWQTGISIPIQKRTKTTAQEESSAGLSDISTQVGYEYLTDWNYSVWRPRAVGYVSMVFPAGKSIYESQTLSGIDARGRGLWSVGLGSVFTKNYNKWDYILNIEAHSSFKKTVNNAQFQGKIKQGSGGNFSIGAGYNLNEFRIGLVTALNFEEAIDVEGAISSQGNLQRYSTATLSVSYMLKNNYSTAISYSDQTLLESPSNSTLARSVAFLIQKKWNR